jgi:hypothetical protein
MNNFNQDCMQLLCSPQTKGLHLVTCTKIEGEKNNAKQYSVQVFYSLENEGR